MTNTWHNVDISDYCDMIRIYAEKGIKKYKSLDSDVRTPIENFIFDIERDEKKIQYKFSDMKKGKDTSVGFIPMPDHNDRGYRYTFFRPKIQPTDGGFLCDFSILFWVGSSKEGEYAGRTFAYRMEAIDAEGAHCYPHIQICRALFGADADGNQLETSLPGWLPDSYPAFPIVRANPTTLFATMLVSVHGFDPHDTGKFAYSVLRDSFSNSAPKVAVQLATDIVKWLFVCD
ncbi:hypothetical protein [Pelagibacterium halotolerans]|uniref:hypothetical protein n=1 Tax=Pelagibacterium halotolerans TaxID=531813 RepID=UPI00384CE94C